MAVEASLRSLRRLSGRAQGILLEPGAEWDDIAAAGLLPPGGAGVRRATDYTGRTTAALGGLK